MKTIIPANPGFYVIYGDKETKKLFVGDPIIAWEIEVTPKKAPTKPEPNPQSVSFVRAITTDGFDDQTENNLGYLNPNGTVTFPYQCEYDSLEDAQKSWEKELI